MLLATVQYGVQHLVEFLSITSLPSGCRCCQQYDWIHQAELIITGYSISKPPMHLVVLVIKQCDDTDREQDEPPISLLPLKNMQRRRKSMIFILQLGCLPPPPCRAAMCIPQAQPMIIPIPHISKTALHCNSRSPTQGRIGSQFQTQAYTRLWLSSNANSKGAVPLSDMLDRYFDNFLLFLGQFECWYML